MDYHTWYNTLIEQEGETREGVREEAGEEEAEVEYCKLLLPWNQKKPS